jgi:AcrR family transcriptional regulator
MSRIQRNRAPFEEAEETRRTILRVAQALFMEFGYRAVTTRQIADACGLTQPALYHYFQDKQALYVAMVQEELAKTKAALERIVHRSEAVQERLRRVAMYLVASTQHDINPMLHDIRHELSPEVQSVLDVSFHVSMISPIASIFEDGLRAGQLLDRQHGGADAVTASYLFLSLISNVLARRESSDRQVNESELVNLIVHVLLYGLTDYEEQESFS